MEQQLPLELFHSSPIRSLDLNEGQRGWLVFYNDSIRLLRPVLRSHQTQFSLLCYLCLTTVSLIHASVEIVLIRIILGRYGVLWCRKIMVGSYGIAK